VRSSDTFERNTARVRPNSIERGAAAKTTDSEVAVDPDSEKASPGRPAVSVVIATWHRPAMLKRCLAAVAAQKLRPAEIVVVDNTEGEEAAQGVALAASARYLVEPTRGVSRARNLGARTTRAEIVAFVDDDAVPEPDWLAALLSEFADESVAAVTGCILPLADDDGAQSRTIFGGPERIVLDQDVPDWFERASFGGVGQGSNLAIRRSVFSAWSGFDERLGAGTRVGAMEEHHAFFSLVNRGYRVVYTPAAKVRHPPRRREMQLQRDLRRITAASFCMALLLVEEPRHRRRAAQYALESFRGTPRSWRAEMAGPGASIPRWRKVLAQVAGLVLYVVSRRPW